MADETRDPCPGREISYWGRVSCRPVDALTRAILPAAAIGASLRAMGYPGPQYDTPMIDGVVRGAAAGAMFGLALTTVAHVQRATRNPVASVLTGAVVFPAALYGAFKAGAIPTA